MQNMTASLCTSACDKEACIYKKKLTLAVRWRRMSVRFEGAVVNVNKLYNFDRSKFNARS